MPRAAGSPHDRTDFLSAGALESPAARLDDRPGTMSAPRPDLERRVGELEDQLLRLQGELGLERQRAAQRARRERWLRIAFWVAIGGAYVIYLQRLSDIVLRQIHQRAFPGHPHSQGAALIQGYARVITNPPFRGAFDHVVMDAIALKHTHRAIIHLHREMHN
jgi:hypothetical protein